MDSSSDGGFRFLHSWSDDLDPAARRAGGQGPCIDLEGVYLSDGDAPTAARTRAAGRSGRGATSIALLTLSIAATWLLIRGR